MILDDLKAMNVTASQESVVNYLLDHSLEACHMTVHELADATFTSHATIIRLTQKLGFKGYKEFQRDLIKEIESEKFRHTDVNFDRPFYQSETSMALINSLSSLYKESIDLVRGSLKEEDLLKAAQILKKSHRVFIFAIGDTRIMAEGFINKMIKLNIYPILATANNEEITMMANMTKEDCVLLVTYNGKSSVLQNTANYAYEEQIPLIVITGNGQTSLAKQADPLILIPHKEGDEKIANFYSQLAFQYLLDLLYSLIYAHDYEKNHKHKKAIDINKL